MPYCVHSPIHNRKDIYMFTSNSFMKKDGSLTMGNGCAKAVRDMFPFIDHKFKVEHLSVYGCKFKTVMNRFGVRQRIGAFQTKVHFKDPSSLDVIRKSVADLKRRASLSPTFNYLLPLPGCELGKLTPEVVLPLLSSLPSNVYVYCGDFKPPHQP